MFVKKIDTITPPITLFFRGNNKHSTIFSGILTIIIHIILIVFTVLYFLDYINKKNPSAFFFNRFINDAGTLILDYSSLLHYVYLINKIDHSFSPFDFDMFRIIGLEQTNIDTYYTSIDLTVTPHWIYGICDIDYTNKSLSYLIPDDKKENSACIKKYYNPNSKKYYDVSDRKNFIWPSIAHGMSNVNYTFYGLIVEKCKDDELRTLSGFGKCKSSEEIYNYISSNAIVLEFIDHYPDVLNYEQPFTKYFYSISNLLYHASYTVNHINLNPAYIKTHNGIFFDHVREEHAFLFDQNEKVTFNEEVEITNEFGNILYDENGNRRFKSTGIISSFYFWLQNRLQCYERSYKKFQDVLSAIGGLSRMLFLAARIINTLIPGYITLLDTEDLLISLNENKNYNQTSQTPISRYKKDIIYPQKNQSRNNFLQQSSKERETVMHNTFSGNEKNEQNKNKKISNVINDYNINNEDMKKSEQESDEKNLMRIKKFKIRNQFKDKESKDKIYNELINNKKEDNEKDKLIEKQNFNWFKYIWYKLFFGKNPHISYYESYRKQIISEEGIFKGSLDIYNLLQFLNLDINKDINSIKYNNSSN